MKASTYYLSKKHIINSINNQKYIKKGEKRHKKISKKN